MKFEVGDIVECIRDDGLSGHFAKLENGDIYEISYSDPIFVKIQGHGQRLDCGRFKLSSDGVRYEDQEI